MKKTDKNIIMINSGGIGQRFGFNVPKQYCTLGGKPIISYVIKACKESALADAILVAADPSYHDMLRDSYGVDVTASGPELNQTRRNGFDYIRLHSGCEKLVTVDAVRPFITGAVLDRVFAALDDFDAVACARKIVDSLGCYHSWVMNREDYYILNPPEGFRFPLFEQCFRGDSEVTEPIQQLPETSRVKLMFDVPYFEKITYPEDLPRAEAILRMMSEDH